MTTTLILLSYSNVAASSASTEDGRTASRGGLVDIHVIAFVSSIDSLLSWTFRCAHSNPPADEGIVNAMIAVSEDIRTFEQRLTQDRSDVDADACTRVLRMAGCYNEQPRVGGQDACDELGDVACQPARRRFKPRLGNDDGDREDDLHMQEQDPSAPSALARWTRPSMATKPRVGLHPVPKAVTRPLA